MPRHPLVYPVRLVGMGVAFMACWLEGATPDVTVVGLSYTSPLSIATVVRGVYVDVGVMAC